MFRVLEGCKGPERATKYSAAIDLFAAEDKIIKAGETAKVRLGICVDEELLHKIICDSGCDFPEHWLQRHYLQLEPRSSLRAKGLIAGSGVIDLDFVYPNEICIILHNPMGVGQVRDCIANKVLYQISKGEKIAQIMLCEHKTFLLGYESETSRTGGFGHSGK